MRRQRGAALLLVVAVLFAVTAAAAFATIRREARRDATELAQQQALAQARDGVTDEASAIEALGHAPLLVPGELENFKVTWPQDLALAERLLATRGARP